VPKIVILNLSDGLHDVVMSFAVRTRISSASLEVYAYQYVEKVGLMLYISSHLTFLMLAIVPPISLGAVGTSPDSFPRIYALTMVIIRYSMAGIKKLSNKTQEALGDMTKVSVFLTQPTVKVLIGAM
jgi:hypothetical protein